MFGMFLLNNSLVYYLKRVKKKNKIVIFVNHDQKPRMKIKLISLNILKRIKFAIKIV